MFLDVREEIWIFIFGVVRSANRLQFIKFMKMRQNDASNGPTIENKFSCWKDIFSVWLWFGLKRKCSHLSYDFGALVMTTLDTAHKVKNVPVKIFYISRRLFLFFKKTVFVFCRIRITPLFSFLRSRRIKIIVINVDHVGQRENSLWEIDYIILDSKIKFYVHIYYLTIGRTIALAFCHLTCLPVLKLIPSHQRSSASFWNVNSLKWESIWD